MLSATQRLSKGDPGMLLYVQLQSRVFAQDSRSGRATVGEYGIRNHCRIARYLGLKKPGPKEIQESIYIQQYVQYHAV